jgi:tetratricopeptide (TPR) repeat protein
VNKYPYNPHAHKNLGNAYGKIGDSEKAEREFLFAIQHGVTGKTLARSHIGLGVTYAKRKEYESAVEHYLRAIELDPSAMEPYLNLGMLYFQQGQHEKALPYYEKVIALVPRHAIAHAALGNVYGKIGNLQRAEEELRLAVRYGDGKTFAESHNRLGILFATRNEHENAVKHFTLSIEADADAMEPHHNLAQTYLDMREIDKASGVLQEMKKRGFNVPEDLQKRVEAAAKNP